MTMWLALPRPPSVNALFATNWKTKRRFVSKKYETWLAEAEAQILLAKPQPIHGPVSINLLIRDAGNIDLANHEKASVDLLVKHGLIDGDGRRHVRKLVMEWGPTDMKWDIEISVNPVVP